MTCRPEIRGEPANPTAGGGADGAAAREGLDQVLDLLYAELTRTGEAIFPRLEQAIFDRVIKDQPEPADAARVLGWPKATVLRRLKA